MSPDGRPGAAPSPRALGPSAPARGAGEAVGQPAEGDLPPAGARAAAPPGADPVPPEAEGTAPPRSPRVAWLRRGLLAFVMLSALLEVAFRPHLLTAAAVVALVAYLALCWRQFSVGAWVPIVMSVVALAMALARDVPAEVLWQAAERMLFLSGLIAMLGTLRSAAAIAPEVARAGVFLTNQPASRRYAALTAGGHLFGVLINFGGLALLLDIAMRAMNTPATASLPPEAREARLRRMSLAIVRGFGMISLWSPFGFATNAILITLPGISYFQFGPLGLAMSFLFMALGWLFDRWEGRRFRQLGLQQTRPPKGSWTGAVALLGHILALGLAIVALHEFTTLSFQQALIAVVPAYSLVWSAVSLRGGRGGPVEGVRQAASATWRRLSTMGPEIGVFASAGFLPVVLLALVPLDDLRVAVAAMGLGAIPLALGIALTVFGLAFTGINPIVSATVLGAISVQLAVPGLSDTAIALAIIGGWTAVIGFSPFITTIILTSATTGRPVGLVGPVWNGAYSLTVLVIWCAMLAGLMAAGLI